MSTKKLTRIALTSAILFVSQIALAGVPNCEIVSLLVIVFTLSFGKEMILSVWIFALLEIPFRPGGMDDCPCFLGTDIRCPVCPGLYPGKPKLCTELLDCGNSLGYPSLCLQCHIVLYPVQTITAYYERNK